jgi:hypothetical protein
VNDEAARVWQGLRALVHERYDRRKEVADALGMSFIRAKALRHLATDGPMSMRRLAAALATDAPYTTLVIDDLVSRAKAAADAEEILGEPPAPLLSLNPEDLATLDRIVAALLDTSPDIPHATNQKS